MDLKKTLLKKSLIAAILFTILSVCQILGIIGTYFDWFGFVITLGAYILIAVMLYMKRRDFIISIGFGALAALELSKVIYRLINRGFYNFTLEHPESYFSFLLFTAGLLSLIGIVSAFLIVLFNLVLKDKQFKKLSEKLWFAPSILIVFAPILDMLCYGNFYFTYFLIQIIKAAAILFTLWWVISPAEEKANANGNEQTTVYMSSDDTENHDSKPQTYTASQDTAYIKMMHHILLLLFTFGIWALIWCYRTTAYSNKAKGEIPRTPVNQLLLCMFVPFYQIYWTYKTSERIDKMAREKNITSDLTTVCLITSIFIPIIPPILLQDKINEFESPNLETVNTQPTPSKVEPAKPVQEEKKATETVEKKNETNITIEELKAYKELLDSGVITQEDYDQKKKQILGL